MLKDSSFVFELRPAKGRLDRAPIKFPIPPDSEIGGINMADDVKVFGREKTSIKDKIETKIKFLKRNFLFSHNKVEKRKKSNPSS